MWALYISELIHNISNDHVEFGVLRDAFVALCYYYHLVDVHFSFSFRIVGSELHDTNVVLFHTCGRLDRYYQANNSR